MDIQKVLVPVYRTKNRAVALGLLAFEDKLPEQIISWSDIEDKPTTFTPSAHTQPWSSITDRATTLSGYGITDAAQLDSNGKVLVSQIPAVAITDTYTVATQAAQLALTVQKGDVAIRTDIRKSYINSTGNNASMSDWAELLTPTDVVTSVAGKTGAVTLNMADITGLPTALDGKASATHDHGTFYVRNLSSGSNNLQMKWESGGVQLQVDVTPQGAIHTSGATNNTFIGAVSTQNRLRNLGWSTGVPAWAEVIEGHSDLAYYAYDTDGLSPTAVLTLANRSRGNTMTTVQSKLHVSSDLTVGGGVHVPLTITADAPTIALTSSGSGTTNWLHSNNGSVGFLKNNVYEWASHQNPDNDWIAGRRAISQAGHFNSAGAAVVLSAAGGTVHLRPNGADSSVGATEVRTDGSLLVTGAAYANGNILVEAVGSALKITVMTEAAYDALVTKDSNMIYFLT